MIKFNSPVISENIWNLYFKTREEMTKIYYEDVTPEDDMRINGITEYATSNVYIDKELRGQNYGSRVLKKLKDKYKENRIILYIQELDKNSSNYIQRQKRKEFYIKNEFYESNYSIREFGHNYEVLIYNKDNQIIEKYELLELLQNFMGNKLFKYILENE